MDRIKNLIGEFTRYLLVGGLAFIVDFIVLWIFREFVFSETMFGLYVATAVGFIAGLAVNYILSITFVFASAKKTNAGKSFKDVIIFTIVGVVGLLLSELGMYLGADLLDIHYMIVKIVVTGVVLLWNYLGRKFLIFNKKSEEMINK